MKRIFADTNVLFPFSVMDLLLALSEVGLHELLWTDALLDEWEDVIVRGHRRSKETASAITTAIRDFFPDSEVALSDYQHLIASMPGKDPHDHEHMAAAVAGGATVLLTYNRKDFPSKPLAARRLRVTQPDMYLCELAAESPDEVAMTISRLAAEKRRPPKSAEELLNDLERAGIPRFAAAMRTHLKEAP
jgi:predicted nucleic acid-binding protein